MRVGVRARAGARVRVRAELVGDRLHDARHGRVPRLADVDDLLGVRGRVRVRFRVGVRVRVRVGVRVRAGVRVRVS